MRAIKENIMRKIDWLILALLVISPPFINYVILGISARATVNGSLDGWLGYYGTLVGSLITMFVLYRTRIWNKEDNENTRKTQEKILQYQAKQMWLEGLRKQLDSNYRILDFHETRIIANNIIVGNNYSTLNNLLALNKNIDMQGYNFDLYLSGDDLSQFAINYIENYKSLLTKYGDYVNDLILICRIKIEQNQGGDIKKYVNDSYNHIKRLKSDDSDIMLTNFHKTLVEKLNSDCLLNELEMLCVSRIQDDIELYTEKKKIHTTTNLLLKSEEKSLENILS